MQNTDLSGAPKLEQIEFISLLGVGGMSRVYKARQTLLDRVVAVKVLSNRALSTDVGLQRFQVEAKLTSSLSHANIVQVMNYGIAEDGQAYLVMEYLEGLPLSDVVAKDAPISYRRFQNIFLPLLSALGHAHNKGIIHRDIKPSNIIICKDEQGNEMAKLVDFGIAKAFSDNDSTQATRSLNLTKTGITIGSPTYMSPEQCQGQELDCRSDLYSLACVMFETLNGEPPYTAESPLDVMYKHMYEPRAKTREISARMEIPEVLVKCILWGLNKELANRPESAEKYSAKLSAALDEITLDRAPQVAKQKLKKSNKIGIACAVSLLLVFAGGTLVLLKNKHKQIPPNPASASGSVRASELLAQAANTQNPERICELLDKAIAISKHSSPSDLGDIYMAASSTIDMKPTPMISSQMEQKCIDYASSAARIYKQLKRNNGYFNARRVAVSAYLKAGRSDEALKYLEQMERTEEDAGPNKSWFMYSKMDCLEAARKYHAAELLGKDYIRTADSSTRNSNFYKAWTTYARALYHQNKIADAIREEERMGAELVTNKNSVLPSDRSSILQGMLVLLDQAPLKAIAIVKSELARNGDDYVASPRDECWLRVYLARCYARAGQKDLAIAELLKTLRKAEKEQAGIMNNLTLRKDILKVLISFSGNDPSAQKAYADELAGMPEGN